MPVNACSGMGLALSVIAVILLIFAQVSQINPSAVPRHLRMASLSTTGLNISLSATVKSTANYSMFYAPESDYYTRKGATHAGVQQTYEWGMYGYCASTGGKGGRTSYCTKPAFGFRFQPALALRNDLPSEFADPFSGTLVNATTFQADGYLGHHTHSACYIVFMGTLFAAFALIIGFVPQERAYLTAGALSFISAVFLTIGNSVYNVIFNRAEGSVNGLLTGPAGRTPIGLVVNNGGALSLLWAADAFILAAVVPYVWAGMPGSKYGRGPKVSGRY